MLDLIGSNHQEPWVCIGDFNDISAQEDKKGERQFAQSSNGGLNSTIFNNGLIHLGFSGNAFNWSNKRGGNANIKERIDRGLASTNWRSLFPRATISHLPAIGSDHNPILMDTVGEICNYPKPFKFEKMWTTSQESFGVEEKSWEIELNGSQSYKTCCKIKEIKKTAKDLEQ